MRKILLALSCLALTVLLGGCADRVYLEGMFVDPSLIEVLSPDQKNILGKNNVFQSYAKYSEGTEAYTVDGGHPKHVVMHAGLWSKDLTTIQGSSLKMYERDAGAVSPGSGVAFHTIKGKLYAYSSGEVRENPAKFKALISELVEQVKHLAETEK